MRNTITACCQIAARGMVFKIKEQKSDPVSSVLAARKCFWIVVSEDLWEGQADCCVIPLIPGRKDPREGYIPVKLNGLLYTIDTSTIQTVKSSSLYEYQFLVAPAVMQMVSEDIASRLMISIEVPDHVEKFFDSLEASLENEMKIRGYAINKQEKEEKTCLPTIPEQTEVKATQTEEKTKSEECKLEQATIKSVVIEESESVPETIQEDDERSDPTETGPAAEIYCYTDEPTPETAKILSQIEKFNKKYRSNYQPPDPEVIKQPPMIALLPMESRSGRKDHANALNNQEEEDEAKENEEEIMEMRKFVSAYERLGAKKMVEVFHLGSKEEASRLKSTYQKRLASLGREFG